MTRQLRCLSVRSSSLSWPSLTILLIGSVGWEYLMAEYLALMFLPSQFRSPDSPARLSSTICISYLASVRGNLSSPTNGQKDRKMARWAHPLSPYCGQNKGKMFLLSQFQSPASLARLSSTNCTSSLASVRDNLSSLDNLSSRDDLCESSTNSRTS